MLPGRRSAAMGATVVLEAGAGLLGWLRRDHVAEIDSSRGMLQTLRAQMPRQRAAKQSALGRTYKENGANESAEFIDGGLVGKLLYACGREGVP